LTLAASAFALVTLTAVNVVVMVLIINVVGMVVVTTERAYFRCHDQKVLLAAAAKQVHTGGLDVDISSQELTVADWTVYAASQFYYVVAGIRLRRFHVRASGGVN
jgi:hypothetical protein